MHHNHNILLLLVSSPNVYNKNSPLRLVPELETMPIRSNLRTLPIVGVGFHGNGDQ